ncbi:hypothetical protein JRI60_50220 [Archangium violaceum]|uniref:hypothetical protein n=1 Tax=Archangium violaceum TaxID=83451 RepID=UPI001952278F|nr:hypothetical protein [Archangium violaceum]QRN97049.1 hypothetical protein JRI60_50220 [Archangium violaceum]
MSRPPPARVAPIVVGDLQYGDTRGYNSSSLAVIDARSGQRLRSIELYRYELVPHLETDVQDVFFTSMKLSDDRKELLVENARGHRFAVNLASEKVRELNHPCELKLLSTAKQARRWQVLVELSTTHTTGRGTFSLDRISFGDSEGLMNDLFEVTWMVDGKEVPYRGEMVKRAPPDHFVELAPGMRHEVRIDLGNDYAFPEAGGVFRIRYRHHNHFSPDDVDLYSNVISVELAVGRGSKPIPS